MYFRCSPPRLLTDVICVLESAPLGLGLILVDPWGLMFCWQVPAREWQTGTPGLLTWFPTRAVQKECPIPSQLRQTPWTQHSHVQALWSSSPQHSPVWDSSLGIQKTLARSIFSTSEGLKSNPSMPIALRNQNLAARLWSIGMKMNSFHQGGAGPQMPTAGIEQDQVLAWQALSIPGVARGTGGERSAKDAWAEELGSSALWSRICHSPAKSLGAHPALS